MSDVVFVGEPIQLGRAIVKNGQLLPGQTLEVSVVDQKSPGTELLPTVVVPETSPGVYNFEWNAQNPNPPPINITTLQALFVWQSKTFPVAIQLRTKSTNTSDLKGVIEKVGSIKGTISDDELTGEIQ